MECPDTSLARDVFLVLLGALAYPVGARVAAVARRVNNALRTQRRATADWEILCLRAKRDLLEEFIQIDEDFISRNVYGSGPWIRARRNKREHYVNDLRGQQIQTLYTMQDAYLEFGSLENLFYKFRRRRTNTPTPTELKPIFEKQLQELEHLDEDRENRA